GKVLKDEITADERTESGTERVESLGEIEPAGGGPFGSENGDVRIRCDLEHGEPEPDHEQRYQKKRIGKKRRSRPEKRAARGGNHQANDDAVLVSKARDRIA